jgi:hypothetical protein
MASISPPLPRLTRSMQTQACPDINFYSKNLTDEQPNWLEKVLAICSVPYKRLGGSFLKF